MAVVVVVGGGSRSSSDSGTSVVAHYCKAYHASPGPRLIESASGVYLLEAALDVLVVLQVVLRGKLCRAESSGRLFCCTDVHFRMT